LKHELETKDKLLSSIHKISGLLTRPISLDRVLNAIVKETAEVFQFSRVNISLINKKNPNLLECKYVIGFTPDEAKRALSIPYKLDRHDCIETRVVKTGKTLYIKDQQKDRFLTEIDIKLQGIYSRVSGIAAPLKIKKEIIGFIGADRTNEILNLTKNEIKLFATFANQVSIIIENARLQEQNKRKIEQFLSLQRISKKTSSTLSLKKLLSTIVANAMKITKASTCAVLLLDRQDKTLKIVSQKGYRKADAEAFTLKIGEGIVGWVALHGVPLLVQDVDNEPRYVKFIKNIKSRLAVPLIGEKQVLGVLSVDSYEECAFSQDDLELLMIFSGHTAALIENARLYEEVITERTLAENILEGSPNGVMTVDCRGTVSSMNRKAEEILSLERTNVVGRNIDSVFQAEVVDCVEEALKGMPAVDNREVTFERSGETHLTLGLSSSVLKGQGGRISGVIMLFRDLTEAKKSEEMIRRMDRLTSLGELSAGLAHEIRNPLASITLNVQMLSKMLTMDDRMRSIVNDTLTGITRIKRLIKGIHDFAKPGFPALRSGCIDDVIMDSVTLLDSQLKKKKIDIHIDLDETVSPVIFDPPKIQQVFINILINAMDALPSGGMINITSTVEHRMPGNGVVLAVSVADNGTGIPPEDVPKIFDPFFTTKPEGTGLGLSITHKILEQHRATINIESVVGRGTTFTMRFPVDGKLERHVPL
jgi:PAS domain S-box-containing protein